MAKLRVLSGRVLPVVAGWLGCLLVVCSSPTWADDDNKHGAVNTPRRVVSIDGSITEIIYQLGAQDRLVAVDTTSRFPKAATELPDVGYMRQLSAEGILSMQPDLVLTTQAAGPEVVFTQLRQAGVRIVRVDNNYSLQGVLDKITSVAEALGKEAEGRALVQRIDSRSRELLQQIPVNDSPQEIPQVMFLLGAGGRGMMAAGENTQAAAMLKLVGAANAMSYSGYKPVSAEGALQAAPEVVFVAQVGAAAVPTAVLQSLAMTPASQHDRIFSVDVSLMLGFGPRLPEAMQQLMALLYPRSGQFEIARKQHAVGM
tara:strand:+ start:46 stop:987 length:942 start_codon:yes stop_codon:yes gene_type:complete